MNEWKNRFSSLTIQMAGSILRTMKEIQSKYQDNRHADGRKKRHRTIDLPVRSQELHSLGDADDYS